MTKTEIDRWRLGVNMRSPYMQHINTDSYTIYDSYTSQMYYRFNKDYPNLMGDDLDMHLFDVNYNNKKQIVCVRAIDPIIAAIGLMENGYSIIEHITKIVN